MIVDFGTQRMETDRLILRKVVLNDNVKFDKNKIIEKYHNLKFYFWIIESITNHHIVGYVNVVFNKNKYKINYLIYKQYLEHDYDIEVIKKINLYMISMGYIKEY